jgi:energy-coupling factor transport system substrate-specific component
MAAVTLPDRIREISRNQVFRFLLLGGLAAAVNWLVRFPLSEVMPFNAAVGVAYAIGMSVGFALYRTYVFPGSNRPLLQQTIMFLTVNLIGAVVVLGVTIWLMRLQTSLPYPQFVKEGAAHGMAIAIGAVVNFVGHKAITFRHLKRSRPS